ncbi:MAG: DUF4185 domain-containing protein [bacterium]|nr:DUF4185 domain-containing protein [bacterium]
MAQTRVDDYFRITVVDDVTGRGVPLVELKTVNNIRYYTDSAGVVAFYEPGFMERQVFFHVRSHGYEFPEDGFGFRGKRLHVQAGGEAVLSIKRLNIAQRLYRITGAGIYRDSRLLGDDCPIDEPLLNADVLGSDSVVTTTYRGKLFWIWGDTNRPSYPLGNFHVPGATSKLPGQGGLDPRRGVNLEYFVAEDGFAKPLAKMPGTGPTWINALITLGSGDRERLYASYVKVQPPLTVYERGLASFDDVAQEFVKQTQFEMESPLYPAGHAFLHRDQGVEYVYFGNPFPLTRVPATAEQLSDLSEYETYTCLKQGSRSSQLEIERTDSGPSYAWRRNTIPFTPKLQAELIQAGKMRADEGLFQMKDENGNAITIHSGSVNWNEYRRRWIMIGLQSFGTSPLGELWYAESENLVGPWREARKIVSHDAYSFYNPKHHPVLDQDNGRIIFFEGTYTNMFSGNPDETPRYNYNQLMYSLDLSDPRLQP